MRTEKIKNIFVVFVDSTPDRMNYGGFLLVGDFCI